MIRIQLDLSALEGRPTNGHPGFSERLVPLLPGLLNHGCSLGAPGGLEARLQDGTLDPSAGISSAARTAPGP